MLSTQLNDASIKEAVADEESNTGNGSHDGRNTSKSPSRTRSLSDGSSVGLSPSPNIIESSEKRSKDDTALNESPITPRRPSFPARGLSLQMPPRELMAMNSPYIRIPLSPKLDPADTYGSPSIPRRSRGLDFSRAATNLHHSTLAEQSSPDASPTITGRAMNIPNRSNHFTGSAEWPNGNPPSLWSTRGDKAAISSSLGSVNMLGSESSDSSSDDDLMDADEIDESILTLQNEQKLSSGTSGSSQPAPGSNFMGYSPAISSLMNFQRASPRHGKSNKESSSGSGSSMASPKSRSPPVTGSAEIINSSLMNDTPYAKPHSRRESISWAANQLHISGNDSDDGSLKSTLENADGLPNTPGREGQRGVIRRAVTRRGNMLPKTKGFARIRAALAEEGAPIETEVRREAQVIRQVLENDMDLEPTRNPVISTARSSPGMTAAIVDSLDDIPEDDIIATDSDKGYSSSFKQHAMLNSKGKEFWETFPDEQIHRTPPPSTFLPRGSSSGISDDISMDSPSFSTPPSSLYGTRFSLSSQLNDQQDMPSQPIPGSPTRSSTPLPTATDITRKLNNKRRREDDFDPISFKRRAVSPGISVHNSPVMQSPMQRDVNPWGTRPPSNSGSEKGIVEGGRVNGTKRVGLQGMTDTNDGLMKMSIE